MTKAEFRKFYLEQRLALTDQVITELNEQLCNSFFLSVELSAVKVFHTFLPIKKNKEPDTFYIINRIEKEYPSIQLSIPKVNAENGQLESYYWKGNSELKQNKWGISEPDNGIPTPVDKIDLVLVPLLVFDQLGHRVGYGKGFYDRFLATCRKNCKKVGLSYFPPVEMIGVAEEHDQKLDVVVTPQRSYWF